MVMNNSLINGIVVGLGARQSVNENKDDGYQICQIFSTHTSHNFAFRTATLVNSSELANSRQLFCTLQPVTSTCIYNKTTLPFKSSDHEKRYTNMDIERQTQKWKEVTDRGTQRSYLPCSPAPLSCSQHCVYLPPLTSYILGN